MSCFIEFDYVTEDGRELVVFGEKHDEYVKFKAVNTKTGGIVPKTALTGFDAEEIEEFISDNAVEELNFESDFYDRQSD